VSPKFLSPIPKSILLSFIAVIILGTLDHPYGPNILNIDWQTKIFITEGKQPVEITRTPKLEQGEFGRLRSIQSYRLVMKKNKLKSGGDKL
jgi:hypothetical protein